MNLTDRIISILSISLVLTAIAVFFKCVGVFPYSWLWVLSPLWVNVLLIIMGAAGWMLLEYIKEKRRGKREWRKWLDDFENNSFN